MIAEIVVGTLGTVGLASGIGALAFWRKNGNGKHGPNPWRYDPPLQQQHAPEVQAVQAQWPPELAAVLTAIAERLEGSLQKLEVSTTPWPQVVGELERITQRVLIAAKRASDPPPEWATRLTSDLAENDKRLARIASDLSENMADGMARFYSQVSKDLAKAVDLPALIEIADKLDLIVDNIPDADPRPELVFELTRQLADLPTKIGRSVADTLAAEKKKSPSPPTVEKGKGNNPPPPHSPPRNLPPMNPNDLPATPSIPASYVPGTVEVPAGQVWSLLYLIQKQLSPNCPGTSAEFALSADDEILVGGASTLGGPLSEANYAYKLTASDPPRIYRSVFPGNNTPVGEIQVLALDGGTLHVEVQS